jgi:hypothetical protein
MSSNNLNNDPKTKKLTWDPKNSLVQSYFLKQFENKRTPK